MNSKKTIHSVAVQLVSVLILGLVIPLTVGMVIILKQERAILEESLRKYHRETLEILVESTEDALFSFSPDEVNNTVRVLLSDERIVSIEVYSHIYDLYLMRMSKEDPAHRLDSVTLRRAVKKDGEEIGYVQIAVDNGWIIPQIRMQRNRIIVLFSALFFGALLLVVPTIYFKILKRLNRLAKQAEMLSGGELGVVCEWQGKDELSMLGKTLEDMRSKLNDSFKLMQEMAVTDELTELPNRRGFNMATQKLLYLSSRYNHSLSLAIFDLDFFKRINDIHGHAMGDMVLKHFADHVSRRLRNTDLFARIGGEEFVLVMPETSISDSGFS